MQKLKVALISFLAVVILSPFPPFAQAAEDPFVYPEQTPKLVRGTKYRISKSNISRTETNNEVRDAVVAINAYREPPAYTVRLGRQGRVLVAFTNRSEAQRVSAGSGFFIHSDGYILTNKHVVDATESRYMVSLGEGRDLEATVVYRDPEHDLAIIKIDGSGYSTLKLGDSTAAQIGDSIVAVGNALGVFEDASSTGTITALNEDIRVQTDHGELILSNMIESSAWVYPGDSGGPLLNKAGEVLGINTAAAVGWSDPISYAIPINSAAHVFNRAGVKLYSNH
ncbi:MAG TPA: trypsin-like peptidase domain-containing protein [Patescibacteria group bacterium]|nr:trypsin-like peptidase domain-containing protein [Patescibacteria group bacterium]